MLTRTRTITRGFAGLAVAAMLSALFVAVAPSAVAGGGSIVSMINAARAAQGLPELSSNGSLAAVAQSWSAKMAASGDLAHNPGLSSQVSGWRYVGENVGYGPDAATIHRAFMNSSAHRANILDTDFTQVGVGTTTDANGRLWVAEVFRAPTGSTASAPPQGTTSGSSTAKAPTKKAPRTTNRSTGATAGAPAARSAAPTPPTPPTPEELLRGRATAAAAGPGATPVEDPVSQAIRFAAVMRATHG